MFPGPRLASLVCVGAFLGGGILTPVAHLATHRPDHSHGARGELLPLAEATESRARPHPHRHSHRHHSPGLDARRLGSEAGHSTAPAGAMAHGEGSAAHFGVALLSAPPAVAVPTPALVGAVADPRRPRRQALAHPAFPLPRPPPPAASC